MVSVKFKLIQIILLFWNKLFCIKEVDLYIVRVKYKLQKVTDVSAELWTFNIEIRHILEVKTFQKTGTLALNNFDNASNFQAPFHINYNTAICDFQNALENK